MKVLLLMAVLLVARPVCCRSVSEEESVVSVYTTQASAGPGTLDVYQQIATNIAERITSPIYRFLGIGENKTSTSAVTKRPWDKIELLDEPEEESKSYNPIDNEISDRDIEELSVEALQKADKKPEKITLYSSYLPSANLEKNDSVPINDINFDDDDEDELTFDDVNEAGRESGFFVYMLELMGSLVQLAWGALQAVFKGSGSDQSQNQN